MNIGNMIWNLKIFSRSVKLIREKVLFFFVFINIGGIFSIDSILFNPSEFMVHLNPDLSCGYQIPMKKWNMSTNSLDEDEIDTNFSETPTILRQQIRFERISLEQGLSQSTIFAIYQDRTGFLWFGTEDGLNKYDGYEFSVYRHDPDDLHSLSDNTILSIFEDTTGVLWIGTYGRGLNRFERNKNEFTRYVNDSSDANSLVNDSINAIIDDASGSLWIGTWGGLDKLDREKEIFIHYNHDPENPNSLSNDVISDLLLSSNGTLWIGTLGGGLNQYDPITDQFKNYRYGDSDKNTISSDYITSISEDSAGILWIGTGDGGLNRFDPISEEFFSLKSDDGGNRLSQNIIRAVEVDKSGNIWIGTEDYGVDILDPRTGKIQNFSNDQADATSLSQDQVTDLFVDQSGIVWIGTFGGGLNKFDPKSARFAHTRHIPNNQNSLSANIVMSISQDRHGNYWVGSYGGGLDYLDSKGERIIHYKNDPEQQNSLSSNDVWYVYPDREGSIWIGTWGGGLDRLDPVREEFTHYVHDSADPESLSYDYINVIYEDRIGMLWIGTNGGGLERLDRNTGKFTHYLHDPQNPDSISNNQIWKITEDSNGRLWIGTGGGGISILDRESGKFSHFLHDPNDSTSLGDSDVFNIYEDSRGKIWIGTYGNGLDMLDPETGVFVHYRVKDGLPNNVIYGILEDDHGYLWLSTNLGISRFDPSTESFKNFNVSDGLQGNEFNVGAYLKNDRGEFFFGGINGLTSFHPEHIKDITYLPPVVLTSMKQGEEEIFPSNSQEALDDVNLSWSNNNLEFEFVALNYANPEKIQYAYKLDGFDKDWNYIGTSRIGRYTNLPSGTYTLRLKGTNSDGLWNEDGTSVLVKVVPPIWETWWFISIVVLVVITSVIGGYRLRIRSIEARSQELENQVIVRTEEIESRRQGLEALYQADEVIDQHLSLENRLQALVDVSIEILNADKSSIFCWDEEQQKFTITVARGFEFETIHAIVFRKGEGLIGQAAGNGELLIVDDGFRELSKNKVNEEFDELVLKEGIRSYMFLPIKFGNETFGLFNVNFSKPNAIGEEEQRLFLALTQRAALSIQNAQLFSQLRDLAIMDERSRLARDLHDSAKQKAFAALAQLGAATAMIDNHPNAAKNHVSEAEQLVYEVLQELIILIQEMYPVSLREKGLASTVREYVFDWEHQCQIEVELKIENERKLALEIEQALYRVVQESLANIARHSQAKNASLSLIYDTEIVNMVVSDNGVGFEFDQRTTGFGIRSMHERIEMINGELKIESNLGNGTRILVKAPVKISPN